MYITQLLNQKAKLLLEGFHVVQRALRKQLNIVLLMDKSTLHKFDFESSNPPL